MIKRILVLAMVAGTFAGSSIPAAQAGPFKDAVKDTIRHPISVAKVVAGTIRCRLKGHAGTFVC
jgi:hypothetical protein